MVDNFEQKTGIYIVYPNSPILKSIYRPKSYKTMVNEQHTKVGIASRTFASRRKNYVDNFDHEVEFIPVTIIPLEQLSNAECLVLTAIHKKYKKVGRAREWFHTANRQEIVDIIMTTLNESGIDHQQVSQAVDVPGH